VQPLPPLGFPSSRRLCLARSLSAADRTLLASTREPFDPTASSPTLSPTASPPPGEGCRDLPFFCRLLVPLAGVGLPSAIAAGWPRGGGEGERLGIFATQSRGVEVEHALLRGAKAAGEIVREAPGGRGSGEGERA
jgi:hypothetical protein